MKFALLIISLSLSIFLKAQNNMTSNGILDKSIKFHDPKGKLACGDYIFQFEESRPDGSTRKTNARLSSAKETFDITSFRDGHEITYQIRKENTNILFDGNSNFSEEDSKKYRLKKDRAAMMKNYYLYLWHLPMKLKDPGTIIDKIYKEKEFNSYDCYELKVTYEQPVGHDIWYYYFDKKDFQMRGYRFYHNESANDGEYINIDGLTTFENIKIPSKRDWFTHKEDKYLGSDKLIRITKN